MATYYVVYNGSDSTGTGTMMSPWATLNKAETMMVAGDTCNVLDGIYPFSASLFVANSGLSDSQRIAYKSLNWRGAKLVNNTPITDTAADATVQLNADYIDFFGFDISGTGAIGIYSSGSPSGAGSPLGSHNRMRYNYIHDLGLRLDNTHNVTAIDMARYGSGVYCANYNEVSYNTIRNISAAHNSGCNGIYFGTAYGNVFNNIISGLPGFGIKSFHFSNHMTIANNLVFNCGDDSLDPQGGQGGGILIEAGGTGWTAGIDPPNAFSVVVNNILRDCHGWACLYEDADNGGSPSITHVANNTFSNNNVLGSTGIYGNVRLDSGATNVNGLSVDPQFVYYQIDGSGNYRLRGTSPCIGAGTSTGAPATDYDGNARPGWTGYDIGPYQFYPQWRGF